MPNSQAMLRERRLPADSFPLSLLSSSSTDVSCPVLQPRSSPMLNACTQAGVSSSTNARITAIKYFRFFKTDYLL